MVFDEKTKRITTNILGHDENNCTELYCTLMHCLMSFDLSFPAFCRNVIALDGKKTILAGPYAVCLYCPDAQEFILLLAKSSC